MDVLGKEGRQAFGLRSSSQVGLLLSSLVSLILLLSSLYAAEASVFKKARETALEAASPVLALFSGPIAWVQDRVGDFGDYFRVLEQNKALREENAALRQWEEEARSLRGVISALQELDAYEQPPEAKPINALVIGEANEAYAHSMIVNAGADDGVKRGYAAVDERGMIGRIVDVSSHAARILLLNDVQSRIPVFVEGSYVEGLLVGRSTSRPAISITMLADADKIAPGQRVITSGAGGVLPRGLTVGVIDRVNEKEALVDLSADYARTRMVRVLSYEFPQVETGAAADSEVKPADSAANADQPRAPAGPSQRAAQQSPDTSPQAAAAATTARADNLPPDAAATDEGD
jgi:rod shape-determining protein MreC